MMNMDLRACWSTPIFDKNRCVLGTFALYFREPRLPDEFHRWLIGIVTHVASIAISNLRESEALKESEQTLREQLNELLRWQTVMAGREERNMELKKEVNELLNALGREKKYQAENQ